MQNEQEKLISLDADKLEYHKQGVMWLQGTPHYIIDLIKEGNLSYVVVYQADPLEKKNPRKAAVEQPIGQDRFSPNTRLGALANKMFPSKKDKRWVAKPPLFVAPIIPKHVNTFTGLYESGFFEREPDLPTTIGGERKLNRGRNTGVFIGLSSIIWEDKYTIPTDSLVNALIQHKQGDGFYDFSGNDGDKHNPLGSNYLGSE